MENQRFPGYEHRPTNIDKGYYVDDVHRILWIPIYKCASRSVHEAIKPWHRDVLHDEAVHISNDTFTVAVIRHPWDRLMSALWGPLRSFALFENRVQDHILQYRDEDPLYMDPHVRPQAFTLRDIAIDYKVRVESIDRDWKILREELYPHLLKIMPHKHRGVARPVGWKGHYNWDRLLPQYEEDFKLCLDWER